MKTDKIAQQEQLPAIRQLQEKLQRIKPPEKTSSEWSVIESSLFSRLGNMELPRNTMAANFRSFILKPYSLASGCIVAGLAIALTIVTSIQEKDTLPTQPVSLHGALIISTNEKMPGDTLHDKEILNKNLHFPQGVSFATLDHSTFIFKLSHEGAFELSPNSKLTLMETSNKKMTLNLEKGTLLAKVVHKTTRREVRIITPSAQCLVTGTIFKVTTFPDTNQPAGENSAIKNTGNEMKSQTLLTVYEGSVLFISGIAASKKSLSVSTGQCCSAIMIGGNAVEPISESETPIKAISTLELLVAFKDSLRETSGLLDISSNPDDALVMIDDTIIGKTPLLIRKIIGAHSIKLSGKGCSVWQQSVTIGKDSISFVSPRLQCTEYPVSTGESEAKTRKGNNRFFLKSKTDPESTLVAIPNYVEAMIHLTIGEYQKALGILDSLKETYPVDMKSQKSIMKKINSCYAKLGDFSNALKRLEQKLSDDSLSLKTNEKEQILWEIANIKANCIGDYEGAEATLIRLLTMNPKGNHASDAWEKLAKIRYMLNELDGSVAAYETILHNYPDYQSKDRVLFNLAGVLCDDLHHHREAIRLYSKLMADYPHGTYYKSALIARAECLKKTGRIVEAQNDYKKYRGIKN
jgi:outer membrane protein assembly factor BamD (BamD/ComL family)